MGQIALSLPQTNLPNATEDPKIVNDLTLIQNVINGNLDPSNLSASSGIMRATYRSGASNLAANAGDWIVAAPSVTVTLPAPSANAMVAVTANGAVTGATAVTVAGTSIYGLGLAAATSFKLGAPVAPVILQSDGTNWIIVSGQQDTGWVAFTLVNGWSAAAGFYVPATRLIGDRVWMRGLAAAAAGGTPITTLASQFRPASTAGIGTSNGNTPVFYQIASTGVVGVLGTATSAPFDGLSYTLS